MIRSLALALIWVAFIGCWLWLQASEFGHSEVTAKVDLLPNHLIQTQDVLVRGISDRYVVDKVEANKAVLPRNLATEPKLEAGKSLVTVPVSRQLVNERLADVGRQVSICNGAAKLADATVAFLVCNRRENGDCTALLGPATGQKTLPDGVVATSHVGAPSCP